MIGFKASRVISGVASEGIYQCFSTSLLQRNLPQIFALFMEPYAMNQVSILSLINQMGRNGNFGLIRRNPWQPLAES